MKEKLKKLFYSWIYMDNTGALKKEDTYFYRFSDEIGQSNLRMMRSMSIFMLIISLGVIATTYTYFAEVILRDIYTMVVVFEIVLLVFIHLALKMKPSSRTCNILASLHLLHMLAIAGYIGVLFCQNETALIFVVILTISSMIFTLPSILTMSISTFCTLAVLVASYYVKERYWFESDVLNGISVLIFSILFGWKINQIRAEEAFARADALRLNDELKKISVTDILTGLYNHRSFQDSYYKMFSRASTEGLPLGVVMMDLDKFKSYNDNYGHVAGDYCLSKAAEAMAASAPKGGVLCRYGGEEFILLLNENLCYEAEIIGEEIRKAVLSLKIPHEYAGLETGVVTLSLGAYIGVPMTSELPMSFVEQADEAMYLSKEKGRNRLTVRIRELDTSKVSLLK